jgi:hypothetical protein
MHSQNLLKHLIVTFLELPFSGSRVVTCGQTAGDRRTCKANKLSCGTFNCKRTIKVLHHHALYAQGSGRVLIVGANWR